MARTIVGVVVVAAEHLRAERQHDEQRERHDRHQHRQRQQHADVLAEDELPAMDRLRDEREHRLAIELFVDEVDADEDGDERAEELDADEADVADDAQLLVQRALAEEVGRGRAARART